jgi:hypothetical protein
MLFGVTAGPAPVMTANCAIHVRATSVFEDLASTLWTQVYLYIPCKVRIFTALSLMKARFALDTRKVAARGAVNHVLLMLFDVENLLTVSS